MIPDFNSDGNLPPGVYTVTIEEVIERFQGKNLRRKQLTRNLDQFCSFIREHSDEVYLFGTYITSKPAPRDVDLLIVFPKTFDWSGPDAGTLLHFQNIRYRLHLNICRHNERGDRRYTLTIAGLTKDDPPKKKGFIKLELRHDKKR